MLPLITIKTILVSLLKHKYEKCLKTSMLDNPVK